MQENPKVYEEYIRIVSTILNDSEMTAEEKLVLITAAFDAIFIRGRIDVVALEHGTCINNITITRILRKHAAMYVFAIETIVKKYNIQEKSEQDRRLFFLDFFRNNKKNK